MTITKKDLANHLWEVGGCGVCQGSCRVSHFLSGLFILPLRVQIYRTDGCPIACAA